MRGVERGRRSVLGDQVSAKDDGELRLVELRVERRGNCAGALDVGDHACGIGHGEPGDRLVHTGQEEVDPLDFDEILDEKMKLVEMDKKYKDRFLNEGFSGGEKKKNEILQMAVLDPKLAILDETDSGLDIDALKVVSEGINKLINKDKALILITHYQRLLNYIKPDFVHVFSDGKIIKTGDKSLAHELEAQGYDWLTPATK